MSQLSMLVYFDAAKTLWIDLDASKEFGFGAVVFHVKDNERTQEGKWPTRSTMQPILFLSRLLTSAEQNYWPTELEIAGFVWVIKKVRHMVESSKNPTRVQTDHSAILDIFKQSCIVSTTSTMRMNVRLVRVLQFLRQFRLEVTHKPGKEHILPDALSRLASCCPSVLPDDHSELDALFAATLVDMNEEFYSKLLEGYQEDNFWKRVIAQIDENHALGENAVPLPFVRGEHLPAHETDPYFRPRAGESQEGEEGHEQHNREEQEVVENQEQQQEAGVHNGEHTEMLNANDRILRSTQEQELTTASLHPSRYLEDKLLGNLHQRASSSVQEHELRPTPPHASARLSAHRNRLASADIGASEDD